MMCKFVSGGEMYVILPKETGAEEFLSERTSETLQKIQEGVRPRMGKFLLPRFTVESDTVLKDPLTAMGVPLFDGASAPLTAAA